ncbi:MAG: metallopeptidase TldD-related protein [Acidobacteriota bacterium]
MLLAAMKESSSEPDHHPLQPEERVLGLLEETLEVSPADFTEIVWLERRGVELHSNGDRQVRCWGPHPSLLVRVRERQRWGLHRIDHLGASELQNAVRLAMAHSTIEAPEPHWRLVGRSRLPPLKRADLCQRSLARLEAEDIAGQLETWVKKEAEGDDFAWGALCSEGRVVVVNSNGLRRRAWVTAATLKVRIGEDEVAGEATTSARRLDALQPKEVVSRAQARMATGGCPQSPEDGAVLELAGPIVLAPEAVAAMLLELGRVGLGFEAGPDPDSFLAGLFSGKAFSSLLSIYDDGGDRGGLPFPFDLEGRSKARVWLVEEGEVKELEQERRRGPEKRRRRVGSKEPPLAAGGGEGFLHNLFLAPGDQPLQELLHGAEGGWWIGDLSAVEVYDPSTLAFCAVARGVRRIRGGRLEGGLPEIRCQGRLQDWLQGIESVGSEPVTVATGDGIFGGVCTPALGIRV